MLHRAGAVVVGRAASEPKGAKISDIDVQIPRSRARYVWKKCRRHITMISYFRGDENEATALHSHEDLGWRDAYRMVLGKSRGALVSEGPLPGNALRIAFDVFITPDDAHRRGVEMARRVRRCAGLEFLCHEPTEQERFELATLIAPHCSIYAGIVSSEWAKKNLTKSRLRVPKSWTYHAKWWSPFVVYLSGRRCNGTFPTPLYRWPATPDLKRGVDWYGWPFLLRLPWRRYEGCGCCKPLKDRWIRWRSKK